MKKSKKVALAALAFFALSTSVFVAKNVRADQSALSHIYLEVATLVANAGYEPEVASCRDEVASFRDTYFSSVTTNSPIPDIALVAQAVATDWALFTDCQRALSTIAGASKLSSHWEPSASDCDVTGDKKIKQN